MVQLSHLTSSWSTWSNTNPRCQNNLQVYPYHTAHCGSPGPRRVPSKGQVHITTFWRNEWMNGSVTVSGYTMLKTLKAITVSSTHSGQFPGRNWGHSFPPQALATDLPGLRFSPLPSLEDVPPACSESGRKCTGGPLRLSFAVVMWDASLWSANTPGEVLTFHINSRNWRDSMRTNHLKFFKSEKHITWVKWVLTRTPLLQSLSSGSTIIGQT